jgi:hypothetical protein
MKRNQSMGGDANSLRGDPINGPNNTAEKNAAEKTGTYKKRKTDKSWEEKGRVSDK